MTGPGSPRKKPPLPPGAERRQHERFELLAQIELRRDGEVALLPIINISAGGVLVKLVEGEVGALKMGEDVSVFLANDDPPIAVTMEAIVVRVLADSFAVMWTSSDGAAMTELAKLLDHLRSTSG